MGLIIGGAETGLLDSSLNLLNREDRTGKATTDKGSQLAVNVASGNLLYSHKDSFLPSHGADYNLIRTYNSRGVSSDSGQADDARWALSTAISLTERNSGGETFYQVTYGDGSVFSYYRNAEGNYVSTDGVGAYETLDVVFDENGSAANSFIVTRADQSQLTFDKLGNLTRWEDTNGQYIGFEYKSNRIARVIDGSGVKEHTLDYNYSAGHLTSVTDELGNVLVQYTYRKGRLSAVQDREGHVTRYFYTTDGYLSSIELPVDGQTAARVISFEYASVNTTSNGKGLQKGDNTKVLSKMTDAEGNVTTFDYAFILNNKKNSSEKFYDGGTTTVTDAHGHVTSYDFDANGNITRVVDALGFETTYDYDTDDNLLSVTDREGNTSSFTYDERGNQLTSTDNAGNTTTFTYTDFNKLETVTAPEGGVTRFDYDSNQNLITRTDPSGDITRFEYDLFGNLKKEIVELGGVGGGEQVTEFFYDAFGNNIRTIDAEDFETKAEYDHFGNLVKFTDANGGVYEYTYDHDDRLVTTTDPIGRIITNSYDAVGNRIATTIFDSDGLLRSVTSVYDRNNLLISTTDLSEGEASKRTVSRTYDVVGNETSVTDAEGRTTTYTFNARRELFEIETTTVAGADGSTPTTYSSSFRYDKEGNAISFIDNRGNTTTYRYTANYLLLELEDAKGQVTQYAYDKNSNLISIIAGMQLEESKRQKTTFAYDIENQLIREVNAEGNALAESNDAYYQDLRAGLGYPGDISSDTGTPLTDDEKAVLRALHTTEYAYDAPGNVVQIVDANDNPTEFEYDLNNRLIRETYAEVYDAVTDSPVRHFVEYSYDGNGNQVSRRDENGNVTLFTFDAVDRNVKVTDANGIDTDFEYDGNDNVTRITVSGAGEAPDEARVSTFRYNNFDELLSETDGLGNALATSDSLIYQNLREGLGYDRMLADLDDSEKAALRDLFTTRYTYDKVSNLLSETDREGRTTRYAYDNLDRLVLITDAANGTRQFRYDGNGNLLTEIDPLGRITSYAYDAVNQQTEVVDPLAIKTTSEYDAFGNLVKTIQAYGGVAPRTTEYRYDLNNRLLEIAEPAGRGESYRYDAVGNRIEVTDARNNSTKNHYDARNRLVKILDPKTFETRFEYDGVGNTINIIDPRNGNTTFSFDPGNRLLSVVDPEGRKTSYTYDARGNQVTETTADGTGGPGSLGAETTQYEYDLAGNLRAIVDAENGRTELGYDRVYNQTRTTDAEGNTVTTRFDALNREIVITDAEGGVTRFDYDAVGNTLKVIDPNGNALAESNDAYYQNLRAGLGYPGDIGSTPLNDSQKAALRALYTTEYKYDDNNQITTVTDALNVRTQYFYDDFGSVVTIKRAEGLSEQRITQFKYDNNGNLVQEIDALNGDIYYQYDVNNNLTRTTDQRNNSSYLAYDENNRLVTITDALNGVTRYQYDGNGNRVKVTDANGNATTFYYNANDELDLQVDALGYATEYEYDANGNVIRTTKYVDPVAVPVDPALRPTLPPADTSRDDTERFEYDKLNRLVKSTDGEGGIREFVFDAVGNVVESKDANGNSTLFKYDGNNRQVKITDALGSVQLFTYDAVGNRTGETDQNGGLRQNQYDALNRLTRTIDPLLGERTFTYDAVGNLVAETDENTNPTTYAYDALDRRISRTNARGDSRYYTYDAVGNLLEETDENGKKAVSKFDELNRVIESVNPETGKIVMRYDAVGNQIEVEDEIGGLVGLVKLGYDALNQLLTRQDAEGGVLKLGYDYAGNQTYVEDQESVRTSYTWDRNGLILSEQLGSLAPVTYVYDAQGNRTSRTDENSNTTTYQYDKLNRKTKETDPLNASQTISYDAVGNIVSVRDQRSGDFHVEYDANNRRVALLSKEGYLSTFHYDAFGNETQRNDYNDVYVLNGDGSLPAPNVGDVPRITSSRYNELNQVVSITEPGGQVTGFEYDAAGNVIAIYDGEPPAPAAPISGPAPLIAAASHNPRQRVGRDGNNRIISNTDALGTITEYQLDKKGRIETKIEAKGLPEQRTTTYTYDGRDRLKTETNDLGKVITYKYDRADRLTRKTTSGPSVTAQVENFEYDPSTGRLTAEIDPEGLRKEYDYDDAGNITEIRYIDTTDSDTLLHQEFAEYDANNRLTAQIDGEGVRTEYEYDPRGNKIKTIQSANGATGTEDAPRVTLYAYDAQDRLISITNPEDHTTLYYYDAVGNQDVIVEANGSITRNTFDDAGRILTNTVGAGTVTVNPDGTASVVFSSDNGGVLTTNTYDIRGNVLSTAVGFADGSDTRTTHYEYDLLDRLVAVTDPEGFTNRFEYDAFGNQTRVSVGLYELVSGDAGYDATKAALAAPLVTTFEYDKAGQLVRTTDGEGNVVENDYDALGNRTVVRTGIAATTGAFVSDDVAHVGTSRYFYDGNGRVIRKETPTGGVIIITRDVLGNQTQIETLQSGTEGSGVWSVENFQHDSAGRIVSETNGEGVETRFEFDAFGNNTAFIRAANVAGEERRTEFTYDGMNNLTSETSPLGFLTLFEYDAAGNLVRSTDAGGDVGYSFYDEYNQLVAEVDRELYVTSYTRDSAGNILTLIKHAVALGSAPTLGTIPTPAASSGDRSVIQTFDGNSKRLTETSAGGTTVGFVTKSYEYDSAGLLIRQTDSISNLASSVTGSSAEYGRSADTSDRILQWDWDNAGRLTRFVNVDGVEETYTYDAANNQTVVRIHDPNPLPTGGNDPDRVTTSTYDLSNRLLTETIGANVQLFEYDKAGNVVVKENGLGHRSRITYDLNNRIETLTNPESETITYGYDAVGNLVTTEDGENNVFTLVYDLDDRVIEERNPAVDVFTIDNGVTASDVGIVTNRYDAVGNLLERTDESGFVSRRWYDARGQIVAEVDGDFVLRTYTYNAFGEVTAVGTSLDRIATTVVLDDSAPPPPPAAGMSTITTDYDNRGNPIRTAYPSSQVTTLSGSGAATTATTAAQVLEELSFYNSWGDLVESTNRAGDSSYAYYDSRGRLIAAVDGEGFLIRTFYDSQDNIVKQTKFENTLGGISAGTAPADPSGKQHVVERFYNAENQLIRELSPEVRTDDGTVAGLLVRVETTFVYDAAGNLRSRTLANGTGQAQTERYYYDAADRRTALVTSGRTLATFAYDDNGNLTEQKRFYNSVSSSTNLDTATRASLVTGVSTSNNDQRTTYLYNAVNKLTRQTDHMGSGTADDIVTSFRYDRSGNLTWKQDGDGYVSQMDYDAAGRVVRTITPNGGYSFVEYNTFGLKTKSWTGGDPTAVAPDVANIGASLTNGADGSFNVSWSYPSGTDTSRLTTWVAWDTVSRADSATPPSPSPGTAGIYANASAASADGISASIDLSALPAGQPVYFRVMVKDRFGNLSWSAQHAVVVPPSIQNITVTQKGDQAFDVDVYFNGAVTNPELDDGSGKLALSLVAGNHYKVSLTGISSPAGYTFGFEWDSGGTTYQTNGNVNLLQADSRPDETDADGWMQWQLQSDDPAVLGADQLIVLNGVVSDENAYRSNETVQFNIGTASAIYNYDLYLGDRVAEAHDFSVRFTDDQQRIATRTGYNRDDDNNIISTNYSRVWKTDNDGKIQTEVEVNLTAAEQGRVAGNLVLGYRTAGNDGRFATTVVMTPSGTAYSSVLDLNESTAYDLKIFYVDGNGKEVVVEWRRIDVPAEAANESAGSQTTTGQDNKPSEPFRDKEVGTALNETTSRSFTVLASERDGLIQGTSGSRTFTEGLYTGPVDASVYALAALSSTVSGTAGDRSLGQLPTNQLPYYTIIEYNDLGIKTASNEGSGVWREFGVDAMGNAVKTTTTGLNRAATSPIVSYTHFDSRGLQTQSVGPADNQGQKAVTTTVYDYALRVKSIQDPGNSSSQSRLFEYDGVGNLIAETDAEGHTTRHYYDLLGNLTKTVDPMGHTQVFQYAYSGPQAGRLTRSYIVGLINTTNETYVYDAFGRRTSLTKGVLGVTTTATTRVTYDQKGRIKTVSSAETNADGIGGTDPATEYWYDKRGNQIWVRDSNGNFFGRTYNEMGFVTHEYSFTSRPSSLANAKTRVQIHQVLSRSQRKNSNVIDTETAYDIFNKRTATWDPMGRKKSYDYGAFGQLKSVDGTTYGYDNFNRLTSQTGGGKNVTRSYDDAGRLLVVNDTGTRPPVFLDLSTSININTRTVYTYDVAGNRKTERLTVQGSEKRNQTYTYNANGELTRWYDSTTDIYQDTEYWADGNVKSVNSRGSLVNYTYDAADRLKTKGGTSYEYDYAGNRTREGSSTFTYNKNGWVKTATVGGAVYEWDYDAVGNVKESRKKETVGSVQNIVTEKATNTYDTSYRLTKTVTLDQTTQTYFDLSGRTTLTFVQDRSGDDGAKNFWYTYNYNSLGQQTSVNVTGSDSAYGSSNSTYDANGRLIQIDRGSGDDDDAERFKQFVYDNDGKIIQTRSSDVGNINSFTYKYYLYALGNPTGEYTNPLIPTMNVGNYSVVKTITGGFEDDESAFPESSITQHTVVAGDTLRALAGQYYGSPDLWFVIAEANGLTGKESLQAGSRLVIPNTAQNAFYTSETHALYKEGDIVGSKLPNVTVPPPPEDDCALVAAIILIVVVAIVAIVLTVVTVGAAAPAAAAAVGGTAGVVAGIAAGAVIGAAIAFAASALTQLILVGFGLQEEFDWEAVAADTVAGAFGGAAAGVGSLVAAAKGVTTAIKVANVAAQLALETAGELASQAIQNDGEIVSPGLVVLAGAGGALGAFGDVAKKGRVLQESTGDTIKASKTVGSFVSATKSTKVVGKYGGFNDAITDVADVARAAGRGKAGVFADVFKMQFTTLTKGKFGTFTQTVRKTGKNIDEGSKLVRTFKGINKNVAEFDLKQVKRVGKPGALKSAGKTVGKGVTAVVAAPVVLAASPFVAGAALLGSKTAGKAVKAAGEAVSSAASAAKLAVRKTFNAGLDAAENTKLIKVLSGRKSVKNSFQLKEVTSVTRVFNKDSGKFKKVVQTAVTERQTFLRTSRLSRLEDAASAAKQAIRNSFNAGLDALENSFVVKRILGRQSVSNSLQLKKATTVTRVFNESTGKFDKVVKTAIKERQSFLGTSRRAVAAKNLKKFASNQLAKLNPKTFKGQEGLADLASLGLQGFEIKYRNAVEAESSETSVRRSLFRPSGLQRKGGFNLSGISKLGLLRPIGLPAQQAFNALANENERYSYKEVAFDFEAAGDTRTPADAERERWFDSNANRTYADAHASQHNYLALDWRSVAADTTSGVFSPYPIDRVAPLEALLKSNRMVAGQVAQFSQESIVSFAESSVGGVDGDATKTPGQFA